MHQTVIAALGDERPGLAEVLEPGEGVEKVLPIMAPYKRASSELTTERTVVRAHGLVVGGTKVAVIAGPCSVESEEQIVSLAKKLKALGATGLRGGAFKPRTSPYSFQGHKEDGLKMLAAAARGNRPGDRHRSDGARARSDGRRSTPTSSRSVRGTCRITSFFQAVGDSGKPALLKRGMSATIDEFLLPPNTSSIATTPT